MITIHLGRFESVDSPAAVVVQQPEDYVPARQFIRQALSQPATRLEVYVLTRTCDGWFWDLEEFPSIVTLYHEDPVTLLREHLHLSAVPSELDDPVLIHQLGLLRFSSPIERVDDPIAWSLGELLDPLWCEVLPSYPHLTRLVGWWAGREESLSVEIQPLVKRQLENWQSQTDGQLRDAYARLRSEDPMRAALFLCCWRALQPYERTTRQRWLEEENWYVPHWPAIADQLGPLPLPARAEKILSRKAEAYWNGRLPSLAQESLT